MKQLRMFVLAAVFLIAAPLAVENAQAAADQPVKVHSHVSSDADNAARGEKFKAYMKSVNEKQSKSSKWFGNMLDSLGDKLKQGQKKNKLSFKQQMEAQQAKRLAERQARHQAKEEERAKLQARKMAREKNHQE